MDGTLKNNLSLKTRKNIYCFKLYIPCKYSLLIENFMFLIYFCGQIYRHTTNSEWAIEKHAYKQFVF